MKELKFRAWNPKTQSYAWPYPESFYIIGEVTVFDMLKQLDMSVIEYNDLVIEQYVGVKDSEGVEIYEGDIVRVCWLAEVGIAEVDCCHVGVVKYDKRCCGYKIAFDPPYRNDFDEDMIYETDGMDLSSYSYDDKCTLKYKVIGNIKQNPELKGAG